jgi:hypothetical protein
MLCTNIKPCIVSQHIKEPTVTSIFNTRDMYSKHNGYTIDRLSQAVNIGTQLGGSTILLPSVEYKYPFPHHSPFSVLKKNLPQIYPREEKKEKPVIDL